ncbi:MAG: hypothetical protein PQJ61_09655 [Spirochaetales bacterium]|uniref:Nucleotidyltransferase n=1 Tax=Candidatus Thalassospirochaeta sargassi TaxID=3119039 RepID=A0AAJ1IIT7_9SPIO|nr:hypothetical protein [Spirochaetales bacterium]
MDISKQEYLENVLSSYRMRHISRLVEKHRTRRDEIKEYLEAHYGGKIYNPMNSGSFAKHTAINSKFDLDLVVPFKRDSFDTLEGMFKDIFKLLNAAYKNRAVVRKQKVSIGIEFYADNDGDEISIDVVPGRELEQDKYPDNYNLNLFVNSRYGTIEEKNFLKTNIKAQIEYIKARDNERKVIRLLKVWKNRHNRPYKSFLLELLTIKAFDDLTPRFIHLHLEVPAFFLLQTYPEIHSVTSSLMNYAA